MHASLRTLATTATRIQYPYFVPRNSKGSLPVYTDIRNGGTRSLLLVRNVDGDANVLAEDLTAALAQPDMRMNVTVVRSKHLVISGGMLEKNTVVEWLREKGF